MKRFEPVIEWALFLCALLSIGTTAGIIVSAGRRDVRLPARSADHRLSVRHRMDAAFRHAPVSACCRWSPGTILVSAIAMAVALPMGLLSAIYLSEYAPPRPCAG